MFDIGWTELLVIAVVAIVVVGPKDLPRLLRTLGRYLGKLRQTANEFRAQIDEAMRESELEDLRKEVEELKSVNPVENIKDSLNAMKHTFDDPPEADDTNLDWEEPDEVTETTSSPHETSEPSANANKQDKNVGEAPPQNPKNTKAKNETGKKAEAPAAAKADTPEPAEKGRAMAGESGA